MRRETDPLGGRAAGGSGKSGKPAIAGLADGHLEDLLRSGLSTETILGSQIYSASRAEASALVGYGVGPAMVFPYSANGNSYARLKLDHAGPDGKRYRSPKGRGNHLYLPRPLDPADTKQILYITEGEKKCLRAVQDGLLCIALSGVWSWRQKGPDGQSVPIPDLDKIPWADRDVRIVFDSDLATKPDVQAAETAFAAHLAGRGATVSAIRLPAGPDGTKVGLDDYLCAHGVEAFRQLEPIDLLRQPAVLLGIGADVVTDVGFARMLAQSSQQHIRYCEAKGCWFVYDGKRWAQGSGNLVKPFVHQLAHVFHDRAGVETDPDKRKRYREQANRLETDRIIRGIINQAMALRELQIDPTRFDQHRHLLNVLNGTIDLKTGVLQPHNSEDMIARIAPVEYHPDATSDLWEDTIRLAMRDDNEMVAFLQRVFGYALTGYTGEKKFFDAYGPKDTGKTTIHKAFQKMLGPDYAKALRPEPLMHQREPEKIPHEIADLMGVRLVVVSEVPDGQRFNEELMKKLSGGDVVTACFKYGKIFEFDPQLTLVMYSNDRIEHGSDDALWERVRSIPYTFNFKTETDIPGYAHDKDVGLTLEQPKHQQGILAWAVRGAITWHQQGLAPFPEKVERDTEAHRQEVNSVLAFLRERCEEGVGLKVPFQTFHYAYGRWAKEARQERLSAAKLKGEMTRLGHKTMTLTINRSIRDGYVGLQLAPQCEDRREEGF